jgi:hypothetical protein
MQNVPTKSKYCRIEELVPPEIYHANIHRKELMWMFFNRHTLLTVDLLRMHYGTGIIVNNWHKHGIDKEDYSGYLTERGLRDPNTKTGSALSAHKFGRGIDCNIVGVTAQQMRDDMRTMGCFEEGYHLKKKDPKVDPFMYISRVEATLKGNEISWFHFDQHNCALDYVLELHV